MTDVIRDGKRAAAILDDPTVQQAFKECEARCVHEWRHAATVEARELAHAKLIGLGDVFVELKKIMDRGIVEETVQKRAKERENARNPRTT